jgi:uncharacterized repeat protein (TIGR03803 family)
MMKSARVHQKERCSRRNVCAVFLFCAAISMASHGQTFETVADFDDTNGAGPVALVQGFDGNFYGATAGGGSANCYGGCGTIFKMSAAGTITSLYNFCSSTNCADGSFPHSLIQAADGNFYGTTMSGGTSDCYGSGCGTLFKITPAGVFTTLYRFCAQTNCPDGEFPNALMQATDGNLYGTTLAGGINNDDCNSGCGTVFKITPSGAFTTLYSFCSRMPCYDGTEPTALIQASNGNFYGATSSGGGHKRGTLFKMTTAGTLSILYTFCSQTNCSDGISPDSLLQAADGSLYGTTYLEDGYHGGCFETGCGTIFNMSSSGIMTTLYTFCSSQDGCTRGSGPGELLQGTDGNLYGRTQFGGGLGHCLNGCGTVFKITPNGTLTTLYDFCPQNGCLDGAIPGALVQATNGSLFGTAAGGGSNSNCNKGCGTIFSLALGLGPFVETDPTSGKVGWKVTIFGGNLKGATGVSFNGMPATFTVVTGTKITAMVPTGASTGTVQVTTPSGILSGNVAFRVMP